MYKIPKISNIHECGFTGYIDNIPSSYFENSAIIRDIASGNRPYISFSYNDKITTLFQRYTDDKLWVSCCDQPINYGVCIINYREYNKNNLENTSSITLKILSDLLNYGYSIYEDIKYELNTIK